MVDAGASRLTSTLGNVDVGPEIAKTIDHTLLKPDATQDQIAQLCYEARKYGFAAVCVNPTHVKLCSQLLQGSPVHVCTVVGFPLGATPPEVKAYEAQQAIDDGATEVDMVINIGALKSKDYALVERDIATVARTCHAGGRDPQGDHRGGAADRRGKGDRLPVGQGGRRRLCQDEHRLWAWWRDGPATWR